jgi:hypothetical protein
LPASLVLQKRVFTHEAKRFQISIHFPDKFLCISFHCFFAAVFIPANDKHILYEGRIPFKQDTAELTWPGTSVYINFKGKGISGIFKDADTSNYYNVIIDKKAFKNFISTQ